MADESVKIRSGDKELLHSASFIVFGDQETSVEVSSGGETLTFLLKFDDSQSGPLTQRFEALDEHTLRITLVNFKNPLGNFTIEPLEVGTLAGRPLALLMRVDHLQATKLKQVLVTFYLGTAPHG